MKHVSLFADRALESNQSSWSSITCERRRYARDSRAFLARLVRASVPLTDYGSSLLAGSCYPGE